MFFLAHIVILLIVQQALPFPIPFDGGQYRPMPGEKGPLPGSDGDNGMYNRPKYNENHPLPGPDGDATTKSNSTCVNDLGKKVDCFMEGWAIG